MHSKACRRHGRRSSIFQPTHEALETNPQFMQIVSPNETIALISLSTKIGDTTGMINFVFRMSSSSRLCRGCPFIIGSFRRRKPERQKKQRCLKQRVNKAKLPIIAELGHSGISVQEFLELGRWRCDRLNKPIDEGLDIKVGDKLKFIGKSRARCATRWRFKLMRSSVKEWKKIMTSKDYLSQEEIDALLRQSSDDRNAESPV